MPLAKPTFRGTHQIYLEGDLDQSIGPLPLFPVICPTCPTAPVLGRGGSGLHCSVLEPHADFHLCLSGCVLLFWDPLLNLVYHCSKFGDTHKGDCWSQRAMLVDKFQTRSFTSNQHTTNARGRGMGGGGPLFLDIQTRPTAHFCK